MDKTFDLSIVSPEKTLYSGKVVSLVLPSEAGYMGVLADHASLLAGMAAGKITAEEPSGKTMAMDVSGGGFIEVNRNTVTVLLSETPE
jgi:F-type H+-transporting ATPase subunit epsilon